MGDHKAENDRLERDSARVTEERDIVKNQRRTSSARPNGKLLSFIASQYPFGRWTKRTGFRERSRPSGRLCTHRDPDWLKARPGRSRGKPVVVASKTADRQFNVPSRVWWYALPVSGCARQDLGDDPF